MTPQDDLRISPPLRRIQELSDDLGDFTPTATRSYYSLDPNVRYIWIISRGIGWIVIIAIALIALGIFSAAGSPIAPWIMRALFALLPLSVISLVWPLIAYKHWGLALRDHDILVRQGVVFKSVVTLPYSRIQHVDTNSGPVERSMGLATLIVHTAGAQIGSVTVPGLPAEEAEQLRDYLSRMGHTHANL